MAANTIKTRIQLKNDTEENWNKSVLPQDNAAGTKVSGNSFIPLKGEVIVYLTDSTHPFSRFKVGDGTTDVISLPFISAAYADNSATINNYTVDTNVPFDAVFTDTVVELIDLTESEGGG